MSAEGFHIDPACHHAARDLCKRIAPNVFFASHLLAPSQRAAMYSLVAVHQQLRDILLASDSHEDHGSCSGSCGSQSMDEKKLDVCRSVLEYLHQGEKTGKPELDGYAAVVRHWALPAEPWGRYAAAVLRDAGLRRYATWSRLQQHYQDTAGAPGELVMRVLAGPSLQWTDTLRAQLHAWCSAQRLTVAVCEFASTFASGRIALPLDDLFGCKLAESDLQRFAQARSTAGDPRWRQLMQLQRDRVGSLFRGGSHALQAIGDFSSRRAVASLGTIYQGMMDELWAKGADPFEHRVRMGTWGRLKRVPGAIRLALNPTNRV